MPQKTEEWNVGRLAVNKKIMLFGIILFVKMKK